MILLSALLASLTGLVAGERPAQRAQVELSAVAAIAQQGEAVAPAPARPADAGLAPVALLFAGLVLLLALPVRPVRLRLSLKQSWLH